MNIVIVGGGTAGWLAALMISKVAKNIHKISLIESKNIKTIGVGEGSTGFLRGIINNEIWNYECNELEFMKYTNSTPKLGVLFKDWNAPGEEYFEPIDSALNYNDYFFSPLLSSYVEKKIDFSLSSVCGRLNQLNLSPFYKSLKKISHDYNHAHHFDAKLAAEYFEKQCDKKINKICGDVKDFALDIEGKVTELILENNDRIFGDFFIDASGFSRIFQKKMNINFIKFKEMTLNSAIPFRLNIDQYTNTNFYTTAWAQKYGWMWMIPKLDNIGCGYIFDDNYIDEKEAKKEIENLLKTEIDVIKKISFTAGRLENPWNKNVLSVGLSYQFLEPLEATSIHSTIAQLNSFIFTYLSKDIKETMNNDNIIEYNKKFNNLIDQIKDFILIHYSNSRFDTEFWKKMNESCNKNKNILKYIDISKNRLLNKYDMYNEYGGADESLHNWVLCGTKHYLPNKAIIENEKIFRKIIAKNQEENLCKYIESKEWLTSKEFIEFLKN
jgi:hypothetical protein